MTSKIRKFLKFNGRNIVFLSIDGQYWVALKPICQALKVDWENQMKKLKTDPILKDVQCVQPLRDSKNRLQNMVALPEKYIYGWLFSIQSGSDALQEYKKQCYELLYNHFHGSVTQHVKLLEEKSRLLLDLEEAKNNLANNPDFIKVEQIRAQLSNNGKSIKRMDSEKVRQLLLTFQS